MDVPEVDRPGAGCLVGTAAIAAAAPAVDGGTLARAARQEATPSAAASEAAMPVWRFVVVAYEDPYSKKMLLPQEPEQGKRYIGIEVEIRNHSDRPLAVSPGQVRLRDAEATDYTNGGMVGSDPRLYDVNMLPGERVRGWVWFGVPEAFSRPCLVYVPAAPHLLVDVTTIVR